MSDRLPSSIHICPGCGVTAPVRRGACALCKTRFPEQPLVAAGAVGGAVFARVAASYLCRTCFGEAPAPLTFEVSVECPVCQQSSSFPADAWKPALELAHDIADLCGPAEEGRVPFSNRAGARANPFKDVGVEHAFADETFESEPSPLTVQVSPGHPVCSKCRAPFHVRVAEDGTAEATCLACGHRVRHSLPAHSERAAPMLRAVLDVRPHSDRPIVKLGRPDSLGAATFRCAECGAPVAVELGEDLALCRECHATSRVPSGVIPMPGVRPFEPVWVLLDGPSKTRLELERSGAGLS